MFAQERIAKERLVFAQKRVKELRDALPPGKTIRDLFREQHTDPASPLKALLAEAEAKFGPVLPSELVKEESDRSLEEIQAYVAAMPGKVYTYEYTTAAGHRWVSHIVDTTFLRAWMEHPNFYMVK